MSEVRRCRRCKRKRLDDEPPEVRQYKTCAKCRIIERQKKKLRKPLAEETMIYGMKQFQQQNQNANFIHDDIFMDDDVFTGGVRNSARRYEGDVVNPLQQQQQQQQQFYQFQPQQTAQAAIQSQMPVAPLHLVQQQQAQQAQQAQHAHQQHIRNVPVQVSMPETVPHQPISCEICSTKLDRNDELNMNYRLCLECYSNPFRQENVYGNFNEYLMAITTNKYKDIKNYIYIKETDKTFSDHLVYQNKPINSERLYREFILENIQVIYIDPIVASLGCKFNRISSNVSEVNSLPPVFNPVINQYQYKNTKPIRSYHKYFKEMSCEANIYMTFDLTTNILTIKLSQKVFNNSSNYPPKFIDLVHTILKSLTAQDSKSNIGYNYHTALIIFDELVKNKHSYSEDIQQFLSTCNSSDFARDFISFEESSKPESQHNTDQTQTSIKDVAGHSLQVENHSDGGEDPQEDDGEDEEDDEEEEDDEDDIEDGMQESGHLGDQSSEQTETPTHVSAEPSNFQPQIIPAIDSESIQNGVHPKPTGENLDPAFGSQD